MDRSNFDPQVGDSVRIDHGKIWKVNSASMKMEISHANFPLPNI